MRTLQMVSVAVVIAVVFIGAACAQDDPPPAEGNAATVASMVKDKSFDDVLNLLLSIRDACDVGGIPGARAVTGMELSDKSPHLNMLLLMKPDEFVKSGSKFISAVGVYPKYRFDGPGKNDLDLRHMSMTFSVPGQNLNLVLTVVVWGGTSDIRISQWAQSLPKALVEKGDAITELRPISAMGMPGRR